VIIAALGGICTDIWPMGILLRLYYFHLYCVHFIQKQIAC